MIQTLIHPAVVATAALEQSAERHPRRHWLMVLGFLAVAAAAVTLGAFALSSHQIHAVARVHGQLHQVSVQADPSSSASTLAVASVVFGGISTLAAVVSTAVAVVALVRSRSRA